MTNDERITNAVYAAVDELNQQLPKGVSIEKSPDAPLYGASGKLESLDFVTFIMEVEEKINAEFDRFFEEVRGEAWQEKQSKRP